MDILWSPIHSDKFITFGNELRLFQVESITDRNGRAQRSSAGFILSKSTFAQLLSMNSDINSIKCVSCYPKPILPVNNILLAVGQISGKVTLTTCSSQLQPMSSNSSSIFDPCTLIGAEFVPNHLRQCNCIAWNSVDCNMLLAGLDKHRADNSLFIFDIEKSSGFTSNNNLNTSPVLKPISELGMGDPVYSLSWYNYQPKSFVAGINRALKVYDLRNSTKVISSVVTKAVYGATVDPFYDYRMASYFENTIFVWDLRSLEKPIMFMQENKPITKISWCPTRNHVLSSLTTHNCMIKLHEIQHNTNSETSFVSTAIERSIEPPEEQKISSFCWHPTQELRLLYLTSSSSPKDYTFFDRVTLNWSPTSEIIWTNGRKLLQCVDSRDDYYKSINDISINMRERASQDYGLNDKYLPNDENLKSMWKWISLSKVISTDSTVNADKNVKLIGVRQILYSDPSIANPIFKNKKSDLNYSQWIDLQSSTKIPVYRSEERSRALQLCEWSNREDEVLQLIDSLEQSGDFTRAASIAMFNLRIRRAIDCLIKGVSCGQEGTGDPNYITVAMALSGYSGEKNSLWREMCQNLRSVFTKPYLKAIFSFLTSDIETYEEILYDPNLKLADRVAFACIFLPDNKLQYYLDNLTAAMVENGDIEALLLTGASNDGLELLQHYVEATSDVQTVSLVILHSLPSPFYFNPKVTAWVESYRNILNCWRLWNKRALFDIEWNKCMSPPINLGPHLFVTCNYCGKSISPYAQSLSENENAGNSNKGKPNYDNQNYGRVNVGSSNNMMRVQSCLNCRKPLPKCCLCLTPLGTPAGTFGRENEKSNQVNFLKRKVNPFTSWFSWCQTCRHGGHAKHLMDWFKDEAECPVSGCSCKCMSLDTIIEAQS